MRSPRSTHRQVLTNLLSNAALPLSSLAVSPILARSLGVEGRGEVAGAIAPLSLLITIGALGLPDAVTFFIASGRRLSKSGVWLIVVAAVAVSVLLAATAWLFAGTLSGGSEAEAELIRLCSMALPLTALLSVVRAAAAGRSAWGRVALERYSSALFRVGGIVVLGVVGLLTVQSGAIVMACAYFIGLVGYVSIRRKRSKVQRFCVSEDTVGGRGVAQYALRVWIGSLSGILLARLDQVLILPLASAGALGIYVVAVNVSEVVLILNYAIRDVTFTRQSAAADPETLGAASRISTECTLLLAILLGLASPVLLPIVFGSDFDGAYPVIVILLVGIVAGNPGSVAGAGLSARGRPELRSYSLLAACAVNVTLIILLVPGLGAIGGALATLAGNTVAGALNVYWLRVKFGLSASMFYIPRRADFKAGWKLAARFTPVHRNGSGA